MLFKFVESTEINVKILSVLKKGILSYSQGYSTRSLKPKYLSPHDFFRLRFLLLK